MAEDAVDFALGDRAKSLKSLTATTPLRGAEGYHALWNRRRALASESGLSVEHIEDMLDRYGSDIELVLASIKEDESLAKELQGAPEYLRAEVAFAVTHEGAMHLEDVLCHRIRLTYEHRDHGLSALEEIASIMAQLLGWDDKKKKFEIDSYTARVQSEEKARTATDDASSQAIRDHIGDVTDFYPLKSEN